ncbi:hypothetical protein TrCOL_g12723 [Triparma columacea]|uniref:Uncharacterized protein n=1 Tax=Triparma columacea TaxID=722753 RepID=A0A9W7GHI2_9STRA|nr:hypothetical protein TrCOL_g12723 [Triparma columacea]
MVCTRNGKRKGRSKKPPSTKKAKSTKKAFTSNDGAGSDSDSDSDNFAVAATLRRHKVIADDDQFSNASDDSLLNSPVPRDTKFDEFKPLLSCFRKKSSHGPLGTPDQCKANLAKQRSAVEELSNSSQQESALQNYCAENFVDEDRKKFAEPIVAAMKERQKSNGEPVMVVVYGAGDNRDATYIKHMAAAAGISDKFVKFFACDLVPGQEKTVIGIDEYGRREGFMAGFADFGIVRNSTYEAGSAHLTVSAMALEVKAGGKIFVHCLIQQFCATAPTWNSLVQADLLRGDTVRMFEEETSGSIVIMLEATRSDISFVPQNGYMSCFRVENLVGGKGDQREAIVVGLKTALKKDAMCNTAKTQTHPASLNHAVELLNAGEILLRCGNVINIEKPAGTGNGDSKEMELEEKEEMEGMEGVEGVEGVEGKEGMEVAGSNSIFSLVRSLFFNVLHPEVKFEKACVDFAEWRKKEAPDNLTKEHESLIDLFPNADFDKHKDKPGLYALITINHQNKIGMTTTTVRSRTQKQEMTDSMAFAKAPDFAKEAPKVLCLFVFEALEAVGTIMMSGLGNAAKQYGSPTTGISGGFTHASRVRGGQWSPSSVAVQKHPDWDNFTDAKKQDLIEAGKEMNEGWALSLHGSRTGGQWSPSSEAVQKHPGWDILTDAKKQDLIKAGKENNEAWALSLHGLNKGSNWRKESNEDLGTMSITSNDQPDLQPLIVLVSMGSNKKGEGVLYYRSFVTPSKLQEWTGVGHTTSLQVKFKKESADAGEGLSKPYYKPVTADSSSKSTFTVVLELNPESAKRITEGSKISVTWEDEGTFPCVVTCNGSDLEVVSADGAFADPVYFNPDVDDWAFTPGEKQPVGGRFADDEGTVPGGDDDQFDMGGDDNDGDEEIMEKENKTESGEAESGETEEESEAEKLEILWGEWFALTDGKEKKEKDRVKKKLQTRFVGQAKKAAKEATLALDNCRKKVCYYKKKPTETSDEEKEMKMKALEVDHENLKGELKKREEEVEERKKVWGKLLKKIE